VKFVPNVYTSFEGDDAGTGQKVVIFVASVMHPSFAHLRQITVKSEIMIRGKGEAQRGLF